jgi:hypothetical protein
MGNLLHYALCCRAISFKKITRDFVRHGYEIMQFFHLATDINIEFIA